MKRILLPIIAALLLAPVTIKAAPVTVNPSTITAAGPVDELLKILDPLLKLAAEMEQLDDDDITLDMMTKALNLYEKMASFQALYSDYELNDLDRAKLLNWMKRIYKEMTGETMTESDIAEAREELKDYETIADLLGDMDLDL